MSRFSTTIVPLLLTLCVMWRVELGSAQAAAPQAASAPAFDAASIRRREPGDRPPATRMLVTPGRISFQAVLLRDCLQWAFGVAEWQIADGPAWIGRGVRWDIEARAEGAATDAELRQMFRARWPSGSGFVRVATRGRRASTGLALAFTRAPVDMLVIEAVEEAREH